MKSLNISLLWDVTLCCLIYTRLTEELAASILYLIHRPFYHRYSSNPRRCLSTRSSPRETFKHHIYYDRNMLLLFVWKSILLSFCLEMNRRQHFLFRAVFLNRRALASIVPGRERSEDTTICHKISLVQLITNLNVILYLSTCHTIYISVLIFFMTMP
jgi:hypothetical protein